MKDSRRLRRVRTLAASALALAVVGPTPALAADAALGVKASFTPATLGPDERSILAVEVSVPEGWHLWAFEPGEGPQALSIALPDDRSIVLEGEWHGPAPKVVYDKGFERDLAQYGGGQTLRFERIARLGDGAAPGSASISVLVRGQICTEEQCIGQKHEVRARLDIAPGPTGAPAEPRPAGLALTGGAMPPPDGDPLGGQSILSFLLIAFLAGLGALATPCVFPAIPLTVSFFSKFSEESFGRGARLAAFYAISMVAYFTLAGVMISILVGATGIQQFAAHPVFNLVLALVLVFFSLNLLGMFEIRVPSFLLSFTNRIEGKYGPNAVATGTTPVKRSGLRDYVSVGVAAMTATTVFFTCTVAFVGVVVVAAAKGEWFWPTIGMLAFSSAFVLPFFLLALFPQAARRLRGRNGSWLTATRVTLGFIELAAAVKFFSNADLVWQTNLLTRDAALALWVSLFALCGLFLLGKLKMGEEGGLDEHSTISVPRVLLSAGTFAFTLFLAVGLFAGKPLGWVDGWLPPANLPGSTQVASAPGQPQQRLSWIHDLQEGRKVAASKDALVFVNYTGFTCTNCRYMEASVFPLPGIASLLDQMVLVELYTDGIGDAYDANRNDQISRFKTAALPFYSVERADGTVIATFPSSTNDPSEFQQFLTGALAKADEARAQQAAERTPPPEAPAGTLTLKTTRLEGGAHEPAIVPGKWTLVNFWATWCSPCREELKDFLAEIGRDLEARGGRFAAVALEEDDSVPQAIEFMRSVGVPASSALRLPAEIGDGLVDARLGFRGDVPYTILVSPQGDIAWKHNARIEAEELKRVLAEHVGLAALRQ